MGCDLFADPPEKSSDLRITGHGGIASCTGPFEPARLIVKLRHDRSGWFDRTLAEKEAVTDTVPFSLRVHYNCSHGETKKVFVETTNKSAGTKTRSQRRTLSCFGTGIQ